jgi:L-Ala-D/L-Glu epimerase
VDIEACIRSWPLIEPFATAHGTADAVDGVVVKLQQNGFTGCSEAYGIPYEGETPAGILAQIEALRPIIAEGLDRTRLAALLPRGGARCALDCALWDLEAKSTGRPAHVIAGLPRPSPVRSTFTIGLRDPASMMAAAALHAHFLTLKIKVNADDPLAAIRAARAGAPTSRFIVDPNQSWSMELLADIAPALRDLGVVLLEQPLRVGQDQGLAGWRSPLPICADELVHDTNDLQLAQGKYSHINIKLDKAGGLTEALALAHNARNEGFGLMVGCMAGSSLAMAPAHLVAQLCEFVDLDGPLLQREDWPSAMAWAGDRLSPPLTSLWG